MAHILIMPRQGNTVESCIITDWKVKEGDAVSAETVVCEVETDKATFELPAGAAGLVLKILRNAGDDVPVLEPIAVIGEAGEAVDGAWLQPHSGWCLAPSNDSNQMEPGTGLRRSQAPSELSQASSELSQAPSERSQVPSAVSPRARGLAEKEGLTAEGLQGSGPGGRIVERDVRAALLARPALTAAVKAAANVTSALPETGSGLAGRVTVEDLASVRVPSTPAAAEYADTPVKGIRKIISDRMLKSLAETAQFTLNAQAPVGRLQDMRNRMKKTGWSHALVDGAWLQPHNGWCLAPSKNSNQMEPGTGLRRSQAPSERSIADKAAVPSVPSVNDYILFAVSRVLPRFAYMNAHLLGDTIRTFNSVHLGHAVDTPRGLMVPVIKNANLLSLAQISAEAKRLADACKNGQIKTEELAGSTFTVSNLGSLGVTSFTPVLNVPEVGILGVCAITKRLTTELHGGNTEEHGEEKRGRSDTYIGFSLTINHQAVDGAPAARFLKALCEAVADIDLLLMEG